MGGFSQYGQQESESSRWRPALIALVVIVIIGVLGWLLSRGSSPPPTPVALPAYAANLQVSDPHLSTAQNFVGGKVTYLQGKIANVGDKSVTAIDVEAIFRNSLGEIVDRQTQPLRVAAAPLGNPDWVALRMAPLAPGKTTSFRLSFDHISADWNTGFPELRFVRVVAQ